MSSNDSFKDVVSISSTMPFCHKRARFSFVVHTKEKYLVIFIEVKYLP